jgi:hypothetical protein
MICYRKMLWRRLEKGEHNVLTFMDELHAWGHTETVHYTHAARSVAMQIALSSRADFTEIDPQSRIVRAASFFMSYVHAGAEENLISEPHFGAVQFAASDVTEVQCQLIADNCGARAVVSQFNLAPSAASALSIPELSRTVAFLRPINGTVAYRHVVKMLAGGRRVSEQGAIEAAKQNAASFGIDVSTLTMTVSAT